LALKISGFLGTKAVNALSNYFRVEVCSGWKKQKAEFSAGNLILEEDIIDTTKKRNQSNLFQMKLF
jgi:topoisomerase-4 subunit B